MELLVQIGIFVVGLIVLVKASDYFIGSAEKIGLSFGISPFIIGVTIIAFGTSLPELAASIASVFNGNSEIVAGNVVGSNITNILLVLGVTAAFGRQIVVEDDLWDTDMPILMASAVALYFMLRNYDLSLFEGCLFIAGLVFFILNSFKSSRKDDMERTPAGGLQYVILAISGVLVALSAKYTISAVEQISLAMKINPEIIALSVIALGTSLPEVVVSLAAARRGKAAIAVGNVLGSNVFNTFIVMGIPRLLGPLEIKPSIVEFSLPFMVAASFLFLIFTLNKKIGRWEGYTLLVLYIYFIYELYEMSVVG